MQNILIFYDTWSGLIPIFGGIYGLLLAYGILPRNPERREKMQLWRSKFSGMSKILFPFIIIFGFLQLFQVIK